jgi:hypothetical protein
MEGERMLMASRERERERESNNRRERQPATHTDGERGGGRSAVTVAHGRVRQPRAAKTTTAGVVQLVKMMGVYGCVWGGAMRRGVECGRALTAACSAVRWAACVDVLGDDGGENVGDGDDGVGGSAVSRHTRRSTSCRPSAAARVSRSSSAAECSPLPFVASSSRFCAWRFGDDGGEHVGDGERGVGGSERSTASCMAEPRPPAAPSAKRKGKPSADDEAAPETGERASPPARDDDAIGGRGDRGGGCVDSRT